MSDYWRQLAIFNPKDHKEQTINIVGAGAIGSSVTLVLSKMGISNIKVWDGDIVEEHNLPNQMYPLSAKGKKKVEALKDHIEAMVGNNIIPIPYFWKGESFDNGSIVIVATDSMESRKKVWEAVKLKPSIKMLIEGRMGGDVMRIYTVNPMIIKEINRYEKTLYSDEVAVDLPCSAQSIIYNLSGVAGFIASQVKKILKGEEFPNEITFDYKTVMMEVEKW